jgi:hypothetical protein
VFFFREGKTAAATPIELQCFRFLQPLFLRSFGEDLHACMGRHHFQISSIGVTEESPDTLIDASHRNFQFSIFNFQ